MIRKIIHFSDLHLRLFKRHDEYREIFDQFYKHIEEIKPDRIVFAGDWSHSKNQATPELFDISVEFLTKLSFYCPLVMILGNHDLLTNNLERLDILSPMIKAINSPNIKLLSNTGCYEDDNVIWCAWSFLDNNKKPNIEEYRKKYGSDKHFIGLFHGPIKGHTTNLGFLFEDGYDIENFSELDIAMLGDIHNRSTHYTKNDVPAIMPSSLIQQDFGETISKHGFGVYDVQTREYNFIDLENNHSLLHFKITDIEDIENDKEELVNI